MPGFSSTRYPGRRQDRPCLNQDLELDSFSNYGYFSVDLAAPGSGIYSTVLNDGYDFKSGTSLAAPHVTGAVALVWSAQRYITWTNMKARIMNATICESSLDGRVGSNGRLNANKALASWLDFGVGGQRDGDYASPYASMNTATNGVVPSGTIMIKSGENNGWTGQIDKKCYIDCWSGTARIGQ